MSIHYELDEQHVARIVINRPERRNALDLVHFADLTAAWRRFNTDTDAWVAIVTGVPGSFCSGADLRDFLPLAQRLAAEGRTEHQGIPMSVGTDGVLLTLDVYKPIIAAIDGPCLAGGMDLLGGTDIRLCTPEATFGLPEPKRGLMADGGTTARLPRQIGWPAAMELLLTGRAVSAERAMQVGLLNEVIAAEDLGDRATMWALEIAANAALGRSGDQGGRTAGSFRAERSRWRVRGRSPDRASPPRDARRYRGAQRLYREASSVLAGAVTSQFFHGHVRTLSGTGVDIASCRG